MQTTSSSLSHIVKTGADRLLSDCSDLIKNKRLGILTNHTGCLSNGMHIITAIAESKNATLAALFGPEHGIFGNTPDGTVVEHDAHPDYYIPIYSLYGRVHKPTKEMLEKIDVLVCDMQDVGARFYTFISTIALALEAAAEFHVPFVLLDRPNPIRGLCYDGPVREQPLKSFVSWMPIPVTYGLTLGELARLWNEEGWLANGVRADLTVVPMEGWSRDMWYDETGIPWIAPSPNMQRLSTAIMYPGLCFVEGTSISEGRGTASPFELIGAPWADSEKILKELNAFETPVENSLGGVSFSPAEFIPKEIQGVASEPKYKGERCRGIKVEITDRNAVRAVRLGVAVLAAFKRAHPQQTELRHRRFDILTGSSSVRKKLDAGIRPEEIFSLWKPQLQEFGRLREKYFLYR
ncbi:MAG: DUF1343 domain-containing protein [Bacteroidota bacterium]|nr:DUF1343 domain-containing protein [Bacteroidota bacterium]